MLCSHIHLHMERWGDNLEVFAVVFADGLVLLGSLSHMIQGKPKIGRVIVGKDPYYLDLVHHLPPHVPHSHLAFFADGLGLRKGRR